MSLSIKDILNLSIEEQIKLIQRGDIIDAKIVTYDLTTAQTNKEVSIAGNFFGMIFGGNTSNTPDANVNVDVTFNFQPSTNGSEAINFTQGLYINRPFRQVFLTWSAQSGKVAKFIVSSFANATVSVQDNRSQTTIASALSSIITNTTGIALDATLVSTNTKLDSVVADLRGLNGDTGTQIVASGSASNTTTTIRTVTTGKTFYLTAFNHTTYPSASGSGTSTLIVTNGADVLQYTLATVAMSSSALQNTGFGQALPTPIKIPAGYKIKVVSNSANITNYASIFGWEE